MTVTSFSHTTAQFGSSSNEGPLSRRRQRRTHSIFLGLAVLGLLPTVFKLSPAWQAAGLGLLFPGAGFIAVGGWAMLLVPFIYILYLASLFAWFAAGALAAPILVWLLSAAAAGALAGAPAAPGAPYVVLTLALLREWHQWRKRRKSLSNALRLRAERHAYLHDAINQSALRAAAPAIPGEREMTPGQLSSLRYLLDRALQPIGQLAGFDKIEQFQTSALRYQLNHAGYGLSTAQCLYTPSFHGYLSLAQRNMIEQMLQKEIWGYWRWERLWGRFSLDFDPAKDENIMLTGFFGLQICMYMGNTGDMRYAEPSSLTFKYNDRISFPHSVHTIVGSLVKNFGTSAYNLFPCEPNWVYTPCNFVGMKALASYDRLFGSAHFATNVRAFAEKLSSEFTMADGNLYVLRSNLTGFAIPVALGPSVRGYYINPVDPADGRKSWAMARQELTYTEGGQLKILLNGKGLDVGNFKRGHAGTLQGIMSGAYEAGDDEVGALAEKMLDEMYQPSIKDGAFQYTCSNLTNLQIARARFMRRDDWRTAVRDGPPESTLIGPLLTDAAYPAVLVAKAFSRGTDLELVLYPGQADGVQSIKIERLQPNAPYLLRTPGQERRVVADINGMATLDIHLSARTPVTLVPLA